MSVAFSLSNRLSLGALVAAMLAFTTGAVAQAPIINPGAPGQSSRELSADEASQLAGTRYTQADVRFMQDMIPHHHQALLMSRLVATRTSRNELIEVAGRIEKSQADEIQFMQDWLTERGHTVPAPHAHHAMHTSHAMAGMATAEQMAELEAATGAAFDALFLSLMIEHHKGALTMVEDLLKEQGSASEPDLFEFTNDITSDQAAEIKRMAVMLAGYSADPRTGLAAGFRDAGEAISNLEFLATLPKPTGFFDPENPSGLPLKQLLAAARGEEPDSEAEPATDAADAAAGTEREQDEEADDKVYRSPPLSFANTDMAFSGNLLVAGNYHGFNIYDIGNPGEPELLSSVVCPGGQGDVSIVGDLLIMSVEQQRARLDCGLQGTMGKVSDERFLGLRIFDISNRQVPVQVGAVQTCRGSHTHSVVAGPDADGKILVYNSGISPVRDEAELAGCTDGSRYGDQRTALFRIDIIEIPVDKPADARIISSPTVFADPDAGTIAGLWPGGDHGDATQRTSATDHCHDITVFPEKNLAAGACSGNGILFDISDPLNPVRLDDVTDASFAYWHSATFNNDGTKVLFTDEWGGGGRPRCLASDPLTWGANAIFDIVDGRLEFASYYKIPAPQTAEENCVAHNGSVIPVPGRDIFAQAWYQGGLSVIDFTDSTKPFEIAYFDRGPVNPDQLVMGGYWSVYWFDGLIYGTEIARGLDVFALVPSAHLSAHEIAAAKAAIHSEAVNPQQQFAITWPATPIVAQAYLDQLERGSVLDSDRVAGLRALLDRTDRLLQAGSHDMALARELADLAESLAPLATQQRATEHSRLVALSATLAALAERLR